MDTNKSDRSSNFEAEAAELFKEVTHLCDIIVNSPPDTSTKGEIESLAWWISHHAFILKSDN